MSPATQKIISAAGALAESADNYFAWTRLAEGVAELRLEESAADAALLAGGPAPVAEAVAGSWTHVDDAMPDREVNVILHTERGQVDAGWHEGGQDWRWLSGGKVESPVTHWMPFPNPPLKEAA